MEREPGMARGGEFSHRSASRRPHTEAAAEAARASRGLGSEKASSRWHHRAGREFLPAVHGCEPSKAGLLAADAGRAGLAAGVLLGPPPARAQAGKLTGHKFRCGSANSIS